LQVSDALVNILRINKQQPAAPLMLGQTQQQQPPKSTTISVEIKSIVPQNEQLTEVKILKNI
jgi:hypothetical protein